MSEMIRERAETTAELVARGHDKMSPIKAILAKCNWCSRSREDRVDCLVRDCPLWPFRHGADPWRAPKTDAQREAARTLTARRQNRRSLRSLGSAAQDHGGSMSPAALAQTQPRIGVGR